MPEQAMSHQVADNSSDGSSVDRGVRFQQVVDYSSIDGTQSAESVRTTSCRTSDNQQLNNLTSNTDSSKPPDAAGVTPLLSTKELTNNSINNLLGFAKFLLIFKKINRRYKQMSCLSLLKLNTVYMFLYMVSLLYAFEFDRAIRTDQKKNYPQLLTLASVFALVDVVNIILCCYKKVSIILMNFYFPFRYSTYAAVVTSLAIRTIHPLLVATEFNTVFANLEWLSRVAVLTFLKSILVHFVSQFLILVITPHVTLSYYFRYFIYHTFYEWCVISIAFCEHLFDSPYFRYMGCLNSIHIGLHCARHLWTNTEEVNRDSDTTELSRFTHLCNSRSDLCGF